MPKPPIAPHWVERVRVLVETEPHLSGKQIEERLKAQADGRTDYPGERKIRDIKRLHLAAKPEDRRLYAYLRWPESFESGAIPWEASESALELLRVYPVPRWTGWPTEPTHRLARWFWRITQAAPDCPSDWRYYLARTMEVNELMVPVSEQRRLAGWPEWLLRRAYWRTIKDITPPTDHLWLDGQVHPHDPEESTLTEGLISWAEENLSDHEQRAELIAFLRSQPWAIWSTRFDDDGIPDDESDREEGVDEYGFAHDESEGEDDDGR